MAGYGHVNIFTYNELALATKNFRPDLIVGEGGFGFVYRGVIDENVRPGFQATEVAVKELNPDGYQGDKEWLVRINACFGLMIHFDKESYHSFNLHCVCYPICKKAHLFYCKNQKLLKCRFGPTSFCFNCSHHRQSISKHNTSSALAARGEDELRF